jgi:hypothetical protein
MGGPRAAWGGVRSAWRRHPPRPYVVPAGAAEGVEGAATGGSREGGEYATPSALSRLSTRPSSRPLSGLGAEVSRRRPRRRRSPGPTPAGMWFLEEVPVRPSAYAPVKFWFGGVSAGGRTIGRKNVDIRLKATSVSRTHATIRVQSSSFARASRGTVPTVEDSSAYGTFLKYPPRHAASRSSQLDGHHDRLDKETPVEVSEGALLAFGAPSAWWRVGWHPILLCPLSLDDRQTARLEEVARTTGLAVAEAACRSLTDVTHVVTPVCRASSPRFLRSIVEGKFIVTPAWTDALANMVKDACKTASTAPNGESALAATAIPPEGNFAPCFSDEDVAALEPAVLSKAFDRTARRLDLFRGVTFLFTVEDRRRHWNMVVEACGGKSVLLSDAPVAAEKLVRVRSMPPETDGSRGADAEQSCAELDIIRAILSASADAILKVSRGAPPAVAALVPVTDVATPAPSDSDAETADNDAVETEAANNNSSRVRGNRRKRPRRASGSVASAGDGDVGGEAGSGNDVGRPGDLPLAQVDAVVPVEVPHRDRSAAAEQDGDAVASGCVEKEPGESSEYLNPRTYFSVDPPAPPSGPVTVFGAAAHGGSASCVTDVRRFKRKELPVARGRIGMVRVRASDEAAGQIPAAFVKTADKQRPPRAAVEDADDDDDEDDGDDEEDEEVVAVGTARRANKAQENLRRVRKAGAAAGADAAVAESHADGGDADGPDECAAAPVAKRARKGGTGGSLRNSR